MRTSLISDMFNTTESGRIINELEHLDKLGEQYGQIKVDLFDSRMVSLDESRDFSDNPPPR